MVNRLIRNNISGIEEILERGSENLFKEPGISLKAPREAVQRTSKEG
jgi:hypothetical protein